MTETEPAESLIPADKPKPTKLKKVLRFSGDVLWMGCQLAIYLGCISLFGFFCKLVYATFRAGWHLIP